MARFSLAVAVATVLVEVLGAAAPGRAADLPLPVKAALPSVLPYNWTGFYVGGNVGGGFGYSADTWSFFAPGANLAATAGVCRPAGSALCATGGSSNGLNGVIGGVQLGYNWQIANYLAGLEADFDGTGQKGGGTASALFPLNGTPGGTITAPYSESLSFLGTVRARGGYIIANQFLIYGTGGLAYGRIAGSGSETAPGFNVPASNALGAASCVSGVCSLGSWSTGVTKVGWVAGAGVEGAAFGNWSWRVEYLHVDLGSANLSFSTLPGCYGFAFTCGPVQTGTATFSAHVTDEIVRAGFNYRFGPL
jgi:outer membrane immunogenic protein